MSHRNVISVGGGVSFISVAFINMQLLQFGAFLIKTSFTVLENKELYPCKGFIIDVTNT